VVVREERRLWGKQNIHDRCRNCKAECSDTTTLRSSSIGALIERDEVMEKFGDVEGKS
jgi:hypothetical protein